MSFSPAFSAAFPRPFGGVTSAAFSPLNVAGLQLWIDFSDVSSLFQDSARTVAVSADGDVIGAASDKSGNARHHIQATLANKPTWRVNQINGLAVGRGDSNDILTYTGTVIDPANYCVYVVRKSSSTGASIGFRGAGAPFVIAYHISTGNARYNHKADSAAEIGGGTFDFAAANGSFHRHRVRRPGGNTFYQRIGDLTETSVTATIGITTLTTSNLFAYAPSILPLVGDIAAVFAYSPSPSAPDLALLDAYCLSRWGV